MKILLPVVFIGLFSFGDAVAQRIVNIAADNTPAQEVLVLPPSYPVNKSWNKIGAEHSGPAPATDSSSFGMQLRKTLQKAAEDGANTFVITGMKDHNQDGRYTIKGRAYQVPSAEKAMIMEKKNAALDNSSYGYVVVYRPLYKTGFNDEDNFDVVINDTFRFELKANTIYTLKTKQAAHIKIGLVYSPKKPSVAVLDLNAEPGKRYYVRGYMNYPRSGKLSASGLPFTGHMPYLEAIEEEQGELESSLIDGVMIEKKL